MGSKTQNLGLTLTGTTQSDVYRPFKEWRQLINGENCNSNMELIDNAFGQHAQRLKALEGLTPPPVDSDLITDGAAADAGETGRRITALSDRIDDLEEGTNNQKSDWNEIENKPDSYPPESHGHTWEQISDKPDTFTPEAHTHTAEQVGARSSTWMPTAEQVGALPKDGTAANATQLNGKDAVYYLGARNLLDNSNFKDFIAQAGLNGLHGTQSYLGDRWVSSEIVVSASDKNGIALTSDSQFGNVTQMVAVTVGRPYTLVVKGQGEDFLAIVSNSAGSTISSARFVDGQAVCVFTAGEDIAHINLYIGFVDGGGTATLEWTALYEGTYTADNLPPYVAPDPVLELAKCKNAYKIIYVTMKPTFMSGSVRVYRLAYGDIRPTLNAPTIEILSADERNVWSSTGATFTVEAVDQSAKAALIYASGATVDNVDNCYADIRIACIADL